MKIDFRVQEALKSFIEELARRSRWSLSDVSSELAWLGIGVKEEGGVEIVGPLGLRRPFSTWDFGGKKARLTLWIDRKLSDRLQEEFRKNVRSSLREAIHLGTIAFQPKEVKIKGTVFGIERPLAIIDVPKIKDERARMALEKLRRISLE